MAQTFRNDKLVTVELLGPSDMHVFVECCGPWRVAVVRWDAIDLGVIIRYVTKLEKYQ